MTNEGDGSLSLVTHTFESPCGMDYGLNFSQESDGSSKMTLVDTGGYM